MIQSPTRVRASSVPWTTGRGSCFGYSAEISKDFSPRDQVIEKSLVERAAEKYKRLEKARDHAQNKVESNKNLAHKIEMHKKEIMYLTQEIERVIEFQNLVQRSALKIQKVAKGYLVRRGLEIVNDI